MNTNIEFSNQQVLRPKTLIAYLKISKSALYEKINPRSPRFDESFPRPFKLGASATGFLKSSVDNWIQSRIEAASVAGK
ncbi:MAG: AlpA family phage regulatory protein [Gallionella sp.]